MKCLFTIAVLFGVIPGCRSHRIQHVSLSVQGGTITFYSLKSPTASSRASLYAEVDSNGTRTFYSFYPDNILKTKEDQREVKYSLYCGTHPQSGDANIFQRFTTLDWKVFGMGDSLARLKGWKVKRAGDCQGFELEIYLLHGWPERKEFKPL